MQNIPFDKRPTGTSTMSPEMNNATRYYKWTVSQFLPFIGSNILDIGGGFGAHLEYILPLKANVMSVELSVDHVAFMRERFKQYPHFSAKQFDFGADDIQQLVERKFDTIISLNVLEHIQDDIQALHDMRQILEPTRGTVLLQVPALAWLYGSLDYQAGHYRRYTVKDLRRKLENVGFKVESIYYFNAFGVLPWFISGRIFKNTLEAQGVNWQIKMFNNLTPLFKWIESVVHPPLGQSIMAIASLTL